MSFELAGGRPALRARCTICGATASDWRHLLGIGASARTRSPESPGLLLTYRSACSRCGASKLFVDYPA
jgi:hypothetical protein